MLEREPEFVAFVAAVREPRRVQPRDALTSDLASMRLRVLAPARELSASMPVWLVPFSQFIADPQLSRFGRARAVVLGKLSTTDIAGNEGKVRLLLSALENGRAHARLFADLSDDYAEFARALQAPFLAEYQRRLGRTCPLTVPTEAMSERLRHDAVHGVHVIDDPFETAAAAPQVWENGPLHLAWFGTLGEANFSFIERELRQLARDLADVELQIELVTAPKAHAAVLDVARRVKEGHAGCTISFSPWSLTQTQAAIERAHLVWLPQEHRSPLGRVKSHNRLVAALRGGRLPVASPIPAYQELAEYAWVGEPLSEGVRWALAHPRAALQRILAGQRHVEERFSPRKVGRRWAEVLGVALHQAT